MNEVKYLEAMKLEVDALLFKARARVEHYRIMEQHWFNKNILISEYWHHRKFESQKYLDELKEILNEKD